MKLAFIVPGGFGPGQGVIPALVALAEQLARRHEVFVFSLDRNPAGSSRYDLRGARVFRVGLGRFGKASRGDPPRGGAGVAFRLWRALSEAGSPAPFDVLHAFWASPPGLLAAGLKTVLGVPLVVSVGGGERVWVPEIGYGGAGSYLGRARTDLVLGRADAITIGSAFAREFLGERDRARVEVVPLGADLAWFQRPAARAAGPPYRLLHVGSLNRVKDHATLLDAFATIVRQTNAEVTLDCAGEDILDGAVQARARDLALGERVRFHGVLSAEALAPLYDQAHLLLVSSRYESQSVAVLEAAATGLATVGTAVGLLPSLAPDGAVVVPVGDAAGLAREARALLADEPRRRAMGEVARAFARAHDAACTARAFERIYARLPRRRSHW